MRGRQGTRQREAGGQKEGRTVIAYPLCGRKGARALVKKSDDGGASWLMWCRQLDRVADRWHGDFVSRLTGI